MLIRTILVVLLTHAFMVVVADGVAAPTAPDMLKTSAPAIRTVIGFRNLPIEAGINDIESSHAWTRLGIVETKEESYASHRAVAWCIGTTGQMAYVLEYVRLSARGARG